MVSSAGALWVQYREGGETAIYREGRMQDLGKADLPPGGTRLAEGQDGSV